MIAKHSAAIAAAMTLSVFTAPAQAQDAQAQIEAFCARPDLSPNRIVCASSLLKAKWVRNQAAFNTISPKLSPDERAELVRLLRASAQHHAAYCHADAPNPQLPPSPAMETCIAYWQDRNFADFQTLDQRIAARAEQAANQAVGDFFQGLGALLGTALDIAGAAAGAAAAISDYRSNYVQSHTAPLMTCQGPYGANQWSGGQYYCTTR
jgi:hypothetical protein